MKLDAEKGFRLARHDFNIIVIREADQRETRRQGDAFAVILDKGCSRLDIGGQRVVSDEFYGVRRSPLGATVWFHAMPDTDRLVSEAYPKGRHGQVVNK